MRKNAMGRSVVFIFLIAILPLSICAQGKSDEVMATELLQTYFDLLLSGNYEPARDLWEPAALARAERLGIGYDNIPIKADCGSPVTYDFDRVKAFLMSDIYSRRTLDSGVTQIDIHIRIGDELINHSYFARKNGEYFWLISAQDYYAKDWPVKESKYFRFHINPKREVFYNDVAAKSLDNFIEKTAQKIAILPERLRLLAEKKIDYYLCNGEGEVRLLSGYETKGIYDMGTDAVISSIFPHYHEVSHLLINFKLQSLPLFTLPFIQEGMAVYLGGRWQRSSAVMLDFGEYILDYNIIEIDSVLGDKSDANSITADISYPVSACLAEYFITKLGTAKYFELYSSLSGNHAFIQGASPDSIKHLLTQYTTLNWEQLKTDFLGFLKSQKSRGGLIFPGEIATNKEIINDSGLIISTSDKWLKIELFAAPDEKADFNLLFDMDSTMAAKFSTIFVEQYKETRPFEGYRYGIRMDKNEVGLYDYYTNQLMAKYVHDFDPDTKYYDSANAKYSAYFDITLLNGNLPKVGDYKIIR
jgi:hypothetical protein